MKWRETCEKEGEWRELFLTLQNVIGFRENNAWKGCIKGAASCQKETVAYQSDDRYATVVKILWKTALWFISPYSSVQQPRLRSLPASFRCLRPFRNELH